MKTVRVRHRVYDLAPRKGNWKFRIQCCLIEWWQKHLWKIIKYSIFCCLLATIVLPLFWHVFCCSRSNRMQWRKGSPKRDGFGWYRSRDRWYTYGATANSYNVPVHTSYNLNRNQCILSQHHHHHQYLFYFNKLERNAIKRLH